MHSALKHDGKPLYEYARAGIEVEREARARDDPLDRRRRRRWRQLDASTCRAARAPTSARWPKTSATRSAAARISRRLRRTGSGALSSTRRCRSSASPRSTSTRSTPALVAGARARSPTGRTCRSTPKTPAGSSPACAAASTLRRRAAGARARPDGAFLGSGHVAGGELIATRLLSPAEVAGARAAPTPRIEEPESLSPSLGVFAALLLTFLQQGSLSIEKQHQQYHFQLLLVEEGHDLLDSAVLVFESLPFGFLQALFVGLAPAISAAFSKSPRRSAASDSKRILSIFSLISFMALTAFFFFPLRFELLAFFATIDKLSFKVLQSFS